MRLPRRKRQGVLMLARIYIAAALTLMSTSSLAIAQAPPLPAPKAPAFLPCPPMTDLEARYMKDEHDECMAKNAEAVRLVGIRTATLSQNPGEAGCLDKDLAMCLASVAKTLVLVNRDPYHPVTIPIEAKRDIEGKAIEATLEVYGYMPGSDMNTPQMSLLLIMNDGVHVSKVSVNTHMSLKEAKTEEDWNATGVYELVSGVLGGACVGPDKLAFYRHLNDVEKNAQLTHFGGAYYNRGPAGVYASAEDNICGKKMSIATSLKTMFDFTDIGNTPGVAR